MADVTLLDELKASGDNKNKYVRFPTPEMFNQLIDIMKKAKDTPALLDEYVKGGEDTEAKNESIETILAAIKTALKSADGAAKEMLEAEQERLEKKLGRGKKASLNFVLKFLFATSQFKEIQALHKQVT